MNQEGYYVLYLVEGCPYCESAIQLVSSGHREYYARYFDWEDEILLEAKNKYNHRTVPIISKFTPNGEELREEFIGGYTELVKYLEKEGEECQEEREE